MIKVYAIVLLIGFIALLVIILGGTLAENIGRPERDPDARLGVSRRMSLGAALGFGMGGMAAEFSPLELSWAVALVLAFIGAGVGAAWVRYSSRLTDSN